MLLLRPESQAALIGGMMHRQPTADGEPFLDVLVLRDEIKRLTDRMVEGDLSHAESIAASQVITLNMLFAKLSGKALGNMNDPNSANLLRLAFRAQAQCLRSVETLAALKNPAIYARQVNVANQQVVTNGSLPFPQEPKSHELLSDRSSIVRLAQIQSPTHEHARME